MSDSDIIWVRHHRIELALHQLSEGEQPSFRPLLLLHGLGERTPDTPPPGVQWPGPIYGLDFTGHGRSTVPVGGGYTSEILVGDVDAALERLGQVTVLGRGLGGYIALLIAAARPAQVMGAIISDGPGLAGGGIHPGSVSVPYPAPDADELPDPFALIELAADVRPPDYAQSWVRFVTERSGLARPIVVASVIRPEWVAAVAAETGVWTATVPEALEYFATVSDVV